MSRPRTLHHPEQGWIQHSGGDRPIPSDAIVRFQFACGTISEKDRRAGDFIWRRRGFPFDVAAYKIVELPTEEAA